MKERVIKILFGGLESLLHKYQKEKINCSIKKSFKKGQINSNVSSVVEF